MHFALVPFVVDKSVVALITDFGSGMCLAGLVGNDTFHAVFLSVVDKALDALHHGRYGSEGQLCSWFLRSCILQSLVRCWSCLRSTYADLSGRLLPDTSVCSLPGSTVSTYSCQSSEAFGEFHAFLRESGLRS